MKIENILVPVDFSSCSNNALQYAIELASMTQAKLTLFNCYTVYVSTADIAVDLQPILAQDYQEKAENSLSELITSTPDLKNVNYDQVIKVSSVLDGILHTTEEINADLVVMGTRGADNRLNAFFGSNTYHTIKKSKVPVLAIPEKATFKPVKKLLFAADFKHIDDMHGLDIIKTLAGLFKAKIQILHVGEGWAGLSMNQTREAVAIVEHFGQTDHSYHFIKDEVNVDDAIEDHLEENDNELIVLIARKHHFPGSLFKKKITRRTVMHTDLPLLTLPDLR